MKNRKILFSDIDGTFISFKTEGVVERKNIEALNQIRNDGETIVVFVTGLTREWAIKLIGEDVEFDYMISSSGCEIHNYAGELVHKVKGNIAEWSELLFKASSMRLAYGNINRSNLFVNNEDILKDEWIDFFTREFETKFKLDTNHEMLNTILKDRARVGFGGSVEQIAEISNWIIEHLETLDVKIDSKNKMIVNVTNLSAGKGNAIKWFMDWIGVDKKNTYSIGDADNDIEMFKATHTSITFSDSSDNVKSYTNKIIERDVNSTSFYKIIELIGN